ncbi:MAG: response regulator [bacterium]|nr:response regulator [bacterium]
MAQSKVLLVEDDDALRDMYNIILTRKGFEVDLAQDGEEALIKARGGGYAVILLDLLMPKLDGMGVLRRLSVESPELPNGPVILLSNAQFDGMEKEARALGAKNVLFKTDILPAELLKEVKKYVNVGVVV